MPGCRKFFPQLITSCEVRTYKPHLQVYQWAAQKLGREPAGLGLISAHTWDVTGAKACGLWAGWLNRRGVPWDDLGFTPDVTVSSLMELPPVLGLNL